MLQGKIFSFIQLFFHIIVFAENFISLVKGPLYFSVLESESRYNKRVTTRRAQKWYDLPKLLTNTFINLVLATFSTL